MELKPIFPPSPSRPVKGQFANLSSAFTLNLSLTSILLLGATLQALLFMLPISKFYLASPAVTLLVIRAINTAFITYGVLPNPYLEGAQMKKTTVQLPNLAGEFGAPGSEKIAILLLGAKSNHPMGTFAPDFPKVLGYLQKMSTELETDSKQDSGFLGQTFFTRKTESGVNEFLIISYWHSLADVHAFAHSPTHREAWRWWESTLKEHKHIGFMHEVFEADRGMWESVYVNLQPTLAGATTILKKGRDLVQGNVGDTWITPLLEARGKLRTSNGRRGGKEGKVEKEMFGEKDVYIG